MRAGRHGLALGLFAAVLAVWAGAMLWVMRDAALPPQASGTMLAVFEPGITSDQAFASLTRAGARPVRDAGLSFIWVVTGDEPGLAGRLVAEGAIGAYRELPLSPTLAGCVAVADRKIAAFTGL
jgi:hypothetical protein